MAKDKQEKLRLIITIVAVLAIALAALSYFSLNDNSDVPSRQNSEIR